MIRYKSVTVYFKEALADGDPRRAVIEATNYRSPVEIRYEGAMVVVVDSYLQHTAWPAADVQEVKAVPFNS